MAVSLTTSCVKNNIEDMAGNDTSTAACDSAYIFSGGVAEILENKCAVTGCHVSGFQPGDFTSYDVVKDKINSGIFEFYVYDIQSMPPQTSGLALTDCEKKILRNWIKDDAPE